MSSARIYLPWRSKAVIVSAVLAEDVATATSLWNPNCGCRTKELENRGVA